MHHKKVLDFLRENGVLFLIIFIVLAFFWPVFKGFIPFPGDLLAGEYVPYSSNTYLGIAPGGVPNKGQGFDVLRMLFPWKEFAVDSLRNWQIPLWNPYNFSGTPFLANFQNGFFYPFNLLFLIFPKLDAWTLYIIAQPMLSSFFTYLFLKEHRLSKISSIFGGLVFSFSSYMVVWMEYGNVGHSIIWLPLALFSIEKIIKRKTITVSLLLVFSLTLSIFAGYIQTTIYLFIFSLIYSGFRLYQEKEFTIKEVISLAPLFIVPILLSSVQLIPTVELFFQSAREVFAPDAINKLLIPPIHLVTIFAPDFFGNPATRNYFLNGTYIERVSYFGIIPILFLLLAFGKNIPKIFWFFLISAVVILLLSSSNPLSVFIYSFRIPIIGTGVPTRIMYLFVFSGAICSAIGFDTWLKSVKVRFIPQVISLLVVYIILWGYVLLMPQIVRDQESLKGLLVSKNNLILPSFVFIGGAVLLTLSQFVKKKLFFIFAFMTLLIFEQFYFFNKITPFSPREFFYPEAPVLSKLKEIQKVDRSWGFEDGYMEANIQTHERIFSPDGYDPLFIKRYSELVNSGNKGKIESVPKGYVSIVSSFGESLKGNYYRDNLLDMLGVKFILNKNEFLGEGDYPDYEFFPQGEYSLVYQKAPFQIYENKNALPRYFLTDSFLIEKNRDKIITKLYDPNRDPKTVILEEDLKIPIQKGKGEVRLINYTPNKVTFSAETKSNNIFFISDNFFPGWKVLIDDNISKIYRANYSFRAVPVLKGNHRVEFVYSPDSFKIGFIISLISFLSLVMYVIIHLRFKNNEII